MEVFLCEVVLRLEKCGYRSVGIPLRYLKGKESSGEYGCVAELVWRVAMSESVAKILLAHGHH